MIFSGKATPELDLPLSGITMKITPKVFRRDLS